MIYSLVNVSKENDGFVDGVWIQNSTGTLEMAIKKARATEKANSNRIIVAVVENLNYSAPNYCLRTGLKRLDIQYTGYDHDQNNSAYVRRKE